MIILIPNGKMTVFGAIFAVKGTFAHFDEKDTVDFSKQFYNGVRAYVNCIIFAQTV